MIVKLNISAERELWNLVGKSIRSSSRSRVWIANEALIHSIDDYDHVLSSYLSQFWNCSESLKEWTKFAFAKQIKHMIQNFMT